MFRFSVPRLAARLTATLVALVLASQTAVAQIKPFLISGGGPVPKGLSVVPGVVAPHKATGTGTAGLGKYTGSGAFQVVEWLDQDLGTFKGKFTFVAANGDKLACTYGDTGNGASQAGRFRLYPVSETEVVAVFLAEFNPLPKKCTGKFADVTGGSFLMLAVSEPFVPVPNEQGFTPPFDYSWQGLGYLKFDK